MATTVKCPRCGGFCYSENRTFKGNVERTAGLIAGGVASMVVKGVLTAVLPFNPPRTKTASIVMNSFTSEFKCKRCGHIFHAKPIQ